MPKHGRRSQRGISKGTATGTIWIQGKNGDHARTAAARERASIGQGFHCRLQRKNVLRLSDCDEGSDLCRQPDPVQRVQAGACSVRTNDQPRFCAGYAWATSRSYSALQRFWSPRGVTADQVERFSRPYRSAPSRQARSRIAQFAFAGHSATLMNITMSPGWRNWQTRQT
jgi:hypothetical protein